MSKPAGSETFDVAGFLAGLDALHAKQAGSDAALAYAEHGLERARTLGDRAAELTVLNELLGLHRSTGRHAESAEAAVAALSLIGALGLTGSDAHATTLINAATAHRAAGRHDEARDAYARALAVSRTTMPRGDRRLAALHNNLSILHSEAGALDLARDELGRALEILEASSVDPDRDIDIAATHTNLSLLCHDLGLADEAAAHADRSLAIFAAGGHEDDPHFAAALAGHAEASFRLGRPADAADAYRRALAIVERAYGRESDAYAVTAENLAEAELAAGAAPASQAEPSTPSGVAPTPSGDEPDLTGLDLARAYWLEHGKPMIQRDFPEYRGRIAAGLVGHGSECYGFDDALSRDHDWGPGFCLWLTAEDHAVIGERLQAAYDALPATFHGHGPRKATARASGEGRRVGVFEIGAFFESITGLASAPPADRAHEWLALDEATLAAATNGAVFADPLGAFGAARGSFQRMPQDVRLALIGRRLGMMAQAGQYNVPRMLERGDGEAAWLALGEFVRAAASVVFLLGGPTAVGYLPYYKWHFAALRALADRPAARLPDVHRDLAEIVRLSSAACLGGAGFGEGGAGSGAARAGVDAAVGRVCEAVVAELRAQRLTDSDETFLEHQRARVAAHIEDPWLRGL